MGCIQFGVIMIINPLQNVIEQRMKTKRATSSGGFSFFFSNLRPRKRHCDVLLYPGNSFSFFVLGLDCHVTVVTKFFPSGWTIKLFPFTFCQQCRLTFIRVKASVRLLWLISWLHEQDWDGCQEHTQLSSPSVLPAVHPGGAQSKREAGHHPLSFRPFSRSHLGHLPVGGFTFLASAPQCCPWGALTTRCPAGSPCDSRMKDFF